jgi:hypothetical protein
MISPDVAKEAIKVLYTTYRDAEELMLKKVTKRVNRGIKDEGWTERKFAEIQSLKRDVEKTLNRLNNITKKELTKMIETAYKDGIMSAEQDFMLEAVLEDVTIPYRMQRLILETLDKTEKAHIQILRTTTDVYRDIISEVSTGVVSGVETRREIAQEALNRFADKGITCFTDKIGRRWNMASYVEMATRTATGRAAIQGHVDRQVEMGRDLVIISDHGKECERCRPWEGKVLSLSGDDPTHDSLSKARDAGLFHANCRHTLTGYILGLTKPEPGKPDLEGYETTKKQRNNERQIRKWKRRVAVALSPQEKERAVKRVTAYQKEQRELLNGTNIRRKYEREANGKAR